MKKNNYLIVLFLALVIYSGPKVRCQENSIKLQGIVKSDSILLKDVNIINKTNKTGSSSNTFGEFEINASEGDSILFSSIGYSKRIIKISKTHIKNKKIVVWLEEGFNELDEITIGQHLKFDTSKIFVHKNMTIDKDIGNSVEPPSVRKYVDPIGNSSNGISIIGLIFKVTDELFLKKGRLERKLNKRELKQKVKDQQLFINTIVNTYNQSFFINELNINSNKIYIFIDYCEQNGLANLYDSNEFVIKNFLIKQANLFNSIK